MKPSGRRASLAVAVLVLAAAAVSLVSCSSPRRVSPTTVSLIPPVAISSEITAKTAEPSADTPPSTPTGTLTAAELEPEPLVAAEMLVPVPTAEIVPMEEDANEPAAAEETAQDDYEELVGPFDEKIIEDLAKEAEPEKAPIVEVPVPEKPEQPILAEKPPATYDIPLEINAQVQAYVQIFKTVRRASFEKGLSRSQIYERLMKKILAEEGLPQDLYYLALIESAFNPKAYSRARAMGPWQFIESTGRLYRLTRDWWIDERRDPEKSTRAAARHLKDLYAEFGSWPLALAAYNAGTGRVKRALAGSRDGNYWGLKLPSQTKNYVPAFMAAVIIAKEPEKHGFTMDYAPAVECERATVDECTDLDVIARCAGVTVEEIKELNPELLRWCTPPNGESYSVCIPKGTAELFRQQYALIPKEDKVRWRRYQIAKGDTLSAISRKFGTPIQAVMEVNKLKSTSILRVGSYLLIPIAAVANSLPKEETRKVASIVHPESADLASRTKVVYRVRPGDTLWDIAQRHEVGVDEIKSWNPALNGTLLHAGDLLTVWSLRMTPAAAASPKPKRHFTYQVRKGDTLWGIAQRFEREVSDICRVNGFGPSKTLFPGDSITIPGT